jgi:hypothetical protein
MENKRNLSFFIQKDIEFRNGLLETLHSDYSDCISQHLDYESAEMYISQLTQILKTSYYNCPINWTVLLDEIKELNIKFISANKVEKKNIQNLIFDIKTTLEREILRSEIAKNYLEFLNNSLDCN